MRAAAALVMGLAGCGLWGDSAPGQAPDLALRVDTASHTSPYAVAPSPEAIAARARLAEVVTAHGLDPDHGWKLGHALLALGPDATLADGTPVVDHLFAHFGERQVIGDVDVVGFPASKDGQVVEPHAELVLKALTDIGVSPDRAVTVQGTPTTVHALYRGALWRTWIDDDATAFDSWNDTPWALQGLAAWAPPGSTWTASNGADVSLDVFTSKVVSKLAEETAFLAEARAADQPFQKRKQGIFSYTCGGAHLLQGAAHAVGAGFGRGPDRRILADQIQLQVWRFPRELRIVDDLLQQAPEHGLILAVQRLKFTGHHLETLHRAAALGLVDGTDPAILGSITQGRKQLLRSIALLDAVGAFDQMEAVAAAREQTYLDLIGDSAHAIRALDLDAGRVGVAHHLGPDGATD